MAAPAKSKYRRIINVCYYLWFAMCSLLFVMAVFIASVSAAGLLRPDLLAAKVDPDELKRYLYLAVACGFVNVAVILFGRRYFRVAYQRLAELEAHERRGP